MSICLILLLKSSFRVECAVTLLRAHRVAGTSVLAALEVRFNPLEAKSWRRVLWSLWPVSSPASSWWRGGILPHGDTPGCASLGVCQGKVLGLSPWGRN